MSSDLIRLSDLMKFPIRIDHYDKVNGNEHFVLGIESVLEYAENLPRVEAEPVVRCKDCEKSRRWGDKGTLLCYRDETTIHIVKPDAYCDGSQRRYDGDDPEILEFEPVVHAHWVVLESSEDSSLCECFACKEWHTFYGGEYLPKRCPECGAHMDERGEEEDERISHTDR